MPSRRCVDRYLRSDHPLVRDGLANFINQQADLAVCGEAEDSAGAIAGIESCRPDVALIDISDRTIRSFGMDLPTSLTSRPISLFAVKRRTRPGRLPESNHAVPTLR